MNANQSPDTPDSAPPYFAAIDGKLIEIMESIAGSFIPPQIPPLHSSI
jgi:hypothetical protein